MRRYTRILLVLACLFILPTGLWAGECIDWPRLMTQVAIDTTPEGKTVVVEPFSNYTKKTEDQWLEAGLSNLLASMLQSGKGLNVLSGLLARYHPRAKNPDYIINGMFQHLDGTLRIFVKLLQGSDRKLLAQYGIAVSYPENKDFFIQMARTAQDIAGFLKVGLDGDELSAIRDATASTRAYEFYAKGRQLLDNYNANDAEVAKVWFDQAKRVDYRSWLGYEGLLDLYAFLGFYYKQKRKPFGLYFEKAEAELSQMQRLAKRPPPVRDIAGKPIRKRDKGEKLENRFLLAQASFTEGLIAAQQALWEAAAKAFLKAVNYVPEDALTWYQLAKIYEKTGNTAEATKALRKAYELNPCIEK